jgi:mono/diheme cytochrome c family protein
LPSPPILPKPNRHIRVKLSNLKRLLFISLTFGFATISAVATPTPEQLEFFERKVRPVLAEQCYKCHGPEKQKADLRVDSLAALLKPGVDGPIIVPGKPGESLLIKSIKHLGDMKMPEKAPKMPEDQIAALEQWVAMGAPWPEYDKPVTSAANDSAKAHWSYQPIKNPAVPATEGAANPIDAFVREKLTAANLTMSQPADKRTLLRRASYELIGLPPTAEEAETFEADQSPDAFAKVVDRLLASPHYGERWARHWMDVARYADSKGYLAGGVSRDYPFAYTFRDWLIRAFNEDLPYDRFLQLQLAADHLVGSNDPNLAAMGFLTVGRRFLGNIHDIIDDRIDTLTRGTMGLTVACARCHDHKFDPVLQKDYYSIYGVFASSDEPEDLPAIGDIEDKEAKAKYDAELAKRQGNLDQFVSDRAADAGLLASITTGVPFALYSTDRDALKTVLSGKDRQRSRDLRNEIEKINGTMASPPRAMVLRDKPQPVEPRVFIRGNPGRPGEQVKRQFISFMTGEKPQPFTKGSGRLELAQAITDPKNPLTARVMVNRVWGYHFAKGLVRTPGDFGVKGDPPTHPELLDWLATTFMNEGWSIKKLHRLILLSATWQQSSDNRPEVAEKDPENRLLSRQNRKRLDFEATRDSLLASAGQLDRKIGGKSVDIVNPPYSKRRAVYASIDRQNLPGIFRTFDFPSPDVSNPQRFVTTVPQQALFMINSPFVVEQARAIVAKPEFSKAESASEWQIQEIYERVYARRAEPTEVEAALTFVTEEAKRPVESREEKPAWRYGYGFFDAAAGKTNFTGLPKFTKNSSWQGGDKLPDDKLGWVMLDRDGGHVGNDPQHAAIRRWIAPQDVTISIKGSLTRPTESGDGVEGIIVSSRGGELLRVIAEPKGHVETKLENVELKAGDTLDFIVSLRADNNSDNFSWPVVIKTEAAEWNSRAQFAGPVPSRPPPLTPWEKYAQVLLETNEFAFVD